MIDSASGNKIKENKYKILRMSLLLGNDENKEETINNFEDASRDIDAMNDEVYLKELESKFYDTLTLEEEEKKLSALVDYIEGRVSQREALISDFANVTGFELTNLPLIKYYDRLDEYKDRLMYIREYLDNVKKIDILNNEISELEGRLENTYASKEKAEKRNESDEKVLLDKFNNIIDRYSDFKNVTIDNIDNVLFEVGNQVSESKKSLDIFNKSFSTLESAGISSEEEAEYASYVESAKDSYYKNKEQEYLLSIYRLLITNETEYSKIIFKRDAINNILCERSDLRKELNIKDVDCLSDIYDLLDRQYKNIKSQKEDIDSIEVLSKEINTKRDTVKELELDNQKVEILSLLKEFCIIDTYDDEFNNTDAGSNNLVDDLNNGDISNEVSIDGVPNLEVSYTNSDVVAVNNVNSSSIFDDVDNAKIDDSKVSYIAINNDGKIEVKDNQVVDVRDINGVDLKDVVDKANNVMKRVGKMLGVDIEEKEKIISVENSEVPVEETKIEEEKVKNNEISSNNANAEDDNNQDRIIPVDANNLFFNSEDDINKKEDSSSEDFWIPSFDDGGLNSLPDLPVSDDTNSDNFFVNNEMPELKFDFGSNDSEGQ